MFYSRLFLNRQSRAVKRDLADPFQMHRTIMSAFPRLSERDRRNPDSGSILWRIDHEPRSEVTMLIIQSELAPDWKPLLDRHPDFVAAPLGSELPPIDTKERHLTFTAGQVLSFRLRANPTKKIKAEGRKNGVRIGITTEDEQLAWLQRKANDERQPSGFRIHSIVVTPEQTAKFSSIRSSANASNEVPTANDKGSVATTREARRTIAYVAVCFEGVLQVVDPNAFLQTLRTGIGTAKGFGFGLLSLAKR